MAFGEVSNDNGTIFVGKQGDISDSDWEKIKNLFEKAIETVDNDVSEKFKYSMGYWDNKK